jgi:hypothetical protein
VEQQRQPQARLGKCLRALPMFAIDARLLDRCGEHTFDSLLSATFATREADAPQLRQLSRSTRDLRSVLADRQGLARPGRLRRCSESVSFPGVG